jgi:hypothetical protein
MENFKHQIPNLKCQNPKFQKAAQNPPFWFAFLVIGAWDLFGIWDLEIGAWSRLSRDWCLFWAIA